MAPILKESDAVSAPTATATASPSAKSSNETPTRPQPVPLEIPVTVNGARTVEGSDKREPFSETTQTVLVFPHGAVIRIATPLAPGQLVFLTNEKSKKEVVCQVLKSKTGGSASGYVELQFTEPAPGFWGLRVPSTVAPPLAAVPTAPRPVATAPPPVPKTVPPPAPPAEKTLVPSPVPPVAQLSAPPKPTVAPAPPIAVAPPPTAPKLPEPVPPQTSAPVEAAHSPLVSVPPPSPLSSEPVSSTPHLEAKPLPLIPPPAGGPRDYSKEIESLFAVPQAPVIPPPPPATSSPSTDELRQHAARLQEQLSAMLFSEPPAEPPQLSAFQDEAKTSTPVAEVANKILEIAQEESRAAARTEITHEQQPEPKPQVQPEPKLASPVRTPVFSSLNAKDEEVEIPAWLRPLSQHSETVVEEPASTAVPTGPSSELAASDATVSETADAPSRPEVAVFGGQLLGGDVAAESAVASGSKKGLFLGLAAAVVLLAGAAWYYTQLRPSVAKPVPAPAVNAPDSAEPRPAAAANASPASVEPPRTASGNPESVAAVPVNPTPAPARNSAPAESRASKSPAHNAVPAPAPEPPKKPSLGEVHLATPVVRGSGEATTSGEPLPSIDAPVQNTGTDALVAASHRKGPAAPLPVGGDVKPAQLVKSVPPVYPQMAKSQHIAGSVALDVLVDTSGNVADLKVLSGPPLLHHAAVDAVKQWKYTPAQLDGQPTAMHLTVTVQFRAQ